MSDLNIVNQYLSPKIRKTVDEQTINNKQTSTVKSKPQNNTSSYVMGGLAALGVIGLGLFAIKKKNVSTFLKEIGIDDFKSAGNVFKNGKAFTKDGKTFSGVVTTVGKDGLKRNIEYVNGTMKEVKVFRPTKLFDGSIKDCPVSKKTYNYTPDGKIENVDNFAFAHVSTVDPKKHGFQYIKTSSVNLDQKRADGLEKFAQKQEKIKQQKDIKEKIDATRNILSKEKTVSVETIDASFNNYADLRESSRDYDKLVRQYEKLEEKEQGIKENVRKLKTHMHKKTEVNDKTIDAQFAPSKEMQNMNEYYKNLEISHAKKLERKEYLKAHLEEARAIRKAKKAESLKARTSVVDGSVDYDGELRQGQIVKVRGKNGSFVEKFYAQDGKTLLIECTNTVKPNAKSVRSVFLKTSDGDRKICISDGGKVVKLKKPIGKNGKYVDVMRTKSCDGLYIKTTYGNKLYNCTEKNVYRLKDGGSITEYVGAGGDRLQIHRDKKGNVLNEFFKPARDGSSSSPSSPPTAPMMACLVRSRNTRDSLLKRAWETAYETRLRSLMNIARKDPEEAINLITRGGTFNKAIFKKLLEYAKSEGDSEYIEFLVNNLSKKFPELSNEINYLCRSICDEVSYSSPVHAYVRV